MRRSWGCLVFINFLSVDSLPKAFTLYYHQYSFSSVKQAQKTNDAVSFHEIHKPTWEVHVYCIQCTAAQKKYERTFVNNFHQKKWRKDWTELKIEELSSISPEKRKVIVYILFCDQNQSDGDFSPMTSSKWRNFWPAWPILTLLQRGAPFFRTAYILFDNFWK